MIEVPTVFILGAGASSPYGYPLGNTLVSNIAKALLDIEPQREMILAGYSPKNQNAFKQFNFDLTVGEPGSIDTFLQRRPEYTSIGKYLIARIINAIYKSHIDGIELAKTNKMHWYSYFKNLLFGASYEDTCKKNKVKIITFNYDVFLERYLYETLCVNFGVGVPKEFFENIEFIHIHGCLKKLPWEKDHLEPMIGEDNTWYSATNKLLEPKLSQLFQLRHMGLNVTDRDLLATEHIEKHHRMATGIKLFHEGDNADILVRVKQTIQQSKQIYFMGFGFLKENMEKLGFVPDQENIPQMFSGKTFFASSFGKKDSEWRGIRKQFFPRAKFPLDKLGSSDPRIDIDCLKLLENSAEFLI